MGKHVDNNALTYFWSKLKTLLSNKANINHTHDNLYAKKENLEEEITRLEGVIASLNLGFSNNESDM